MRTRGLPYLFLALCTLSCKKSGSFDCFKANGRQTTETRYPGEFDVIKVMDKVDVTILKGSEYKIEVEAGDNIIKNVSTAVKDRELVINNENTCNFVRGYKRAIHLNITVPYISRVENRGVGTTTFDGGFSQDSIKVLTESSGDIYVNGTYTAIATSSNGNGDIYLNGSCKSLYVYMYGTNYLHAEDFNVSSYIFIETLSIGDCYVNASSVSTLSSKIWRSGNIYYSGEPSSMNCSYMDNCKGRLIKSP